MEKSTPKSGIKLFKSIVDSLIVISLGILIFISIPTMIDLSIPIDNIFTSPRLFPKILSILLIILGVTQCLFQLKEYKKSQKKEEEKEVETSLKNYKAFFIGLLAIIIYVIAISYIGFFIATVLTLSFFIYFFGQKKWYKVTLFSVIITTLVYFAFVQLFNVPLPGLNLF